MIHSNVLRVQLETETTFPLVARRFEYKTVSFWKKSPKNTLFLFVDFFIVKVDTWSWQERLKTTVKCIRIKYMQLLWLFWTNILSPNMLKPPEHNNRLLNKVFYKKINI